MIKPSRVLLGLFLGLFPACLLAASFTSSQGGSWSSAATWGGSGTPGSGDDASIGHAVSVSAYQEVGPGTGNAITIGNAGTLTLAAGVTLVCKGDIQASGNITLQAGAILEMDGTGNTIIKMLPGNTKALIRMNGTQGSRCQLRGKAGGTLTRITTDLWTENGARIIAKYSDFKNMGGGGEDSYNYALGSVADSFSFNNCNFDNCAMIDPLNAAGPSSTGFIEFKECVWTNSPGDCIKTYGISGRTYRIINCDFDAHVSIHHPIDMEVEDCVFRGGVGLGIGQWNGGTWKSFARNFLLQTDYIFFEYGRAMVDCIYIFNVPSNTNPHVCGVQNGDGPMNITGNVFWWPGPDVSNAEGDGFMLGTKGDNALPENQIIFERNIFLPNAGGPDGANNLSFTAFTILYNHSDPLGVVFKRNTIYTGSGIGGLNLGETNRALAGDVQSVRSNLFIGGSGGNGYKMEDLGGCDPDAFLADSVDYNAGYRIRDGFWYGNGSGKGYGDFEFTGNDIVGAHDIDDVDPQFVDDTRTPVSWTGSMQATMDRLTPGSGYMVQDLLDYIREGFRPQNQALAGAGDPAAGSPDIGAVDLSSTPDITDPTVAVLSPNGGEQLAAGGNHTITWSDDDNRAVVFRAIYLQTESSGTWSLLDSGAAGGDSTYVWSVGSQTYTSCKIQVTVRDAAGNSASDETDAFFDIVDLPHFTSASMDTATIGELYSYAITHDPGSIAGSPEITIVKNPAWIAALPSVLSGTPTGGEGVDTCIIVLTMNAVVYDSLVLRIRRVNPQPGIANRFVRMPKGFSVTTLSRHGQLSLVIGTRGVASVKATILDLQGKALWQQMVRVSEAGYHDVSVHTGVVHGVYLLRIERKGVAAAQKLFAHF